jgi:hypothetical protein
LIPSSEAKSVLAENAIHHEYKEPVANILDTEKAKMRPFETSAKKISIRKMHTRRLSSAKSQ